VVTPAGKRDHPLILSVGRLERYKGHQRVIAALPFVLEQRAGVRLQIVGSGPYRAALERLASQLGVADHLEIRAVPPDDREEMARLLSRASLVTLLSDYESHGIAAFEALSLGLPVLVSDTSGLRELAGRRLARAIPSNSAPELVAEVIVEQLGRPLVPTDVDLPSWDTCAAELLALYRSVLAVKPCAS
jgi:glycosyltransferase involved in cell wall biosynthesis